MAGPASWAPNAPLGDHVYLRLETGTKAHSDKNIKKLPHILRERAQEQPTTQKYEFEQNREKGWDGDRDEDETQANTGLRQRGDGQRR